MHYWNAACPQVTTKEAMGVAMQAAGAARTEVESQLSKASCVQLMIYCPLWFKLDRRQLSAAWTQSDDELLCFLQALAVPMVRRHARTAEGEHHYGPSVGVVSGNYVTGRRRGIVDGTDFGATGSGVPPPRQDLGRYLPFMTFSGVQMQSVDGQVPPRQLMSPPACLAAVRFVQMEAIRTQLDHDNIVLLTNLAYSAAGEVLNCNIYDVATHAAIELGAEKLICMTHQASRLFKF